ncbi:YitT family protein [Streptomyces sp. NPDC058247]|uniref:membrane protein YczE n=1 Tax=Streptomyces sp. NPDC058247 TaxID=3346401 RepID=UPI0036DFAEB0
MRHDTDMADHSEQAAIRSDGGTPTTAPGRPGGGTRPTPPLTYVRFGERPLRRLPQLFIGLALYGFSMAVMVRSGLGLSPWSVLNEGLEKHTSLSFGAVTAVVGVSVLLLWIPLRQRPAFGTAANIVVIALSSDLGLALVPEGLGLPARVGLLLTGTFTNALSVAVYVGARFGPGPRDGLMTGAAALTGRSIRAVRTFIEIAVLAVGWLLGGGVGPGTVLYALAVGPVTQFFLPWFAYAGLAGTARPGPPVTGARTTS